jgi:hypothetical protein
VAFKTNDYAKINPLAGRLLAIRAIPEDGLVGVNIGPIAEEDHYFFQFSTISSAFYFQFRLGCCDAVHNATVKQPYNVVCFFFWMNSLVMLFDLNISKLSGRAD